MSCLIIEGLESRSLLSVSPNVLYLPAHALSHTAVRALSQHVTPQVRASLVPADFLTSYGGSFVIGAEYGSAALNVTRRTGNTAVGTLAFYDYGGDTIGTGKVTFVFRRNTALGNLKMTFKNRTSSLTGSGGYHAGDLGTTLLFRGGKFDGAKLSRFSYGEVSFMKGL